MANVSTDVEEVFLEGSNRTNFSTKLKELMEAASVRDRLREAQLSNELANQVHPKKRLTKCPHGTWLVYDYYYYDVYVKKKKCPHIVDMVGIFPNPEYSPYDACLLVRKHTAFCRETLRPFVKTVMRQVFEALSWCHKHKIAHCNVDMSSITWEWNETRTEPHIYLTNFEEAENARDFKYEVREIDLRASCILFLELLLDLDIFQRYPNFNMPQHDLAQFCMQINDKERPVLTNLFKKLIGADPTKRITAKKALKHKYFKV